MRYIRKLLSVLGAGGRAFVALVGITGITIVGANYTMTQGTGTDFGSRVVSAVHYAQQLLCDMNAPTTQCAAVVPGNTATTTMTSISVADANILAAMATATPAGSNAIGNVGTAPRAAQLSTTAISFSASGDNVALTRISGTIKVYRLAYTCATAVTQINKNGTSIVFGGAMPGVTSVYYPYEGGEPHFTTTSTNNFVINNSAAVACGGTIWYLDN